MNQKIEFLASASSLHKTFLELSKNFEILEMYVAWIGNPSHYIPFAAIAKLEKVSAHIGIAFNHTHPDGIKFLLNSGHQVKVVDSAATYHPKMYFFSNKKGEYALIMGSSNFTHSAFTSNIEANILLEGPAHQKLISQILKDIKAQIKVHKGFDPTEKWLTAYREKYKERKRILSQSKFKDDAILEDDAAADVSWLNTDTWQDYLLRVNHAAKNSTLRSGYTIQMRFEVFDEYRSTIALPWDISLFDTIENRRRILGISDYAWLGHIGASGDFQRMLANGSLKEKRAICRAMNNIQKLKMPDDYEGLTKELNNLVSLGPSIKVWGRLLAITQPDKYCTISAKWLRKGFSRLMKKPESYFETVDG